MSSSDLLPGVNARTAPLLFYRKEEEEPKDWVKIGAIVAAVIGALIAALAGSCIMGIFPTEMLGGTLGVGITLIVGASILLPAGLILLDKYFLSPSPT